MSSQMGHVGGPKRSVYCASKFAMEGMTKAAAIDLAPHGVRINTICPTFIETPMVAGFLANPSSRISSVQDQARRVGQPSDVTGAVLFLASDASSLMTGTHIIVDGAGRRDEADGAAARRSASCDGDRRGAPRRRLAIRGIAAFTPRARASPRTRAPRSRPRPAQPRLPAERHRAISDHEALQDHRLVAAYLQNHFYPEVIERLSAQLGRAAITSCCSRRTTGMRRSAARGDPALSGRRTDPGLDHALLGARRRMRACRHSGAALQPHDGDRRCIVRHGRECAGRALIAEFLAAAGHRRMAFVAGVENSSTSRDREAGFTGWLAANGLAPPLRAVGPLHDGGGGRRGARAPVAARPARRHILRQRPHGLRHHGGRRHEFGLRIPEDLSLVGFDDVGAARWRAST